MKLRLVMLLALSTISVHAQSIFNCGPDGTAWVAASGTGGACNAVTGSGATFAFARGTTSGSVPYVDSPYVNIAPTGADHTAMAFAYMDNTGSTPTTVNIQAFTEHITFVPNGQYLAITWDNSNPGLPAGASAEGGFYQGECGGSCSTYTGGPFETIAMMFDSYNPLTQTAGSFTYSSVQLYSKESLQPPFLPVSSSSGNYTYYPTNKVSTSPVPLNTPSGTPETSTGDTYSATVGYDGWTVSLCLYDITAANGSCSSSTAGTGTYLQQSWSGILIPSIVGGTTAHLQLIESTGEASTYNLLIGDWSYTVNTPTGSPSFTAYNAGSTYNNGTVSVASPVYSVAPGTYSSTQTVSLSTSTSPNSYICYETSVSTPTLYPWPDQIGGCVQGTLYSGPVSISSTTTLYAVAGSNIVAFGPANTSPTGAGPMSTMVAGTYTIGGSTAATPTFSPVAGTYSGTQSVTLSSSSSGAVICYNTTGSPATNGSTGCTTGTLYSSPVSVSTSETLYAVAGGTGYADSSVGSAAYTINSAAPSVKLSGKGTISGKVVLQ